MLVAAWISPRFAFLGIILLFGGNEHLLKGSPMKSGERAIFITPPLLHLTAKACLSLNFAKVMRFHMQYQHDFSPNSLQDCYVINQITFISQRFKLKRGYFTSRLASPLELSEHFGSTLLQRLPEVAVHEFKNAYHQ